MLDFAVSTALLRFHISSIRVEDAISQLRTTNPDIDGEKKSKQAEQMMDKAIRKEREGHQSLPDAPLNVYSGRFTTTSSLQMTPTKRMVPFL
ncbi:hypothetical protein M8C21_030758 [Ambrosia artemisiifolia]|uniref:Uncharacterized protein n=1 Tax=Ambrosia artemisiifolia TaxID=4212 RepID=A0AAD5GAN0_AMBAR|nr:hypothetical protein M8C21_030758 [Ambrosia artemisiifolia]